MSWWGPQGVQCGGVIADLRVGGSYEITNILPSDEVVVIRGAFIRIDPPNELVYSWFIRPEPTTTHVEQVSVQFARLGAAQTEVVVVHARIGSQVAFASHTPGWNGCLEGLVTHFAEDARL
jgi:uncharacterized protein YndB with AHSA1/START domain